ncbi:hypothetical protein [Rhodococcus qingshengii]|uniref:hypothetical protein n=1 Tax=Rhodococcus qingshengii TaxID=334542 RepID=UPI001C5E7B60|nr:hypothetical protein [Rhodococcus qingshengii]MBW4818787.1 hypothetical protein [Rhodococcus qingshengii]
MTGAAESWAREYQEWLQRVCDTHSALCFTLGHRIGNPARAEVVSFQVVAAMLRRPRVFRYQGLPYSARIGTLVESVLSGHHSSRSDPETGDVADWRRLVEYLEHMPAQLKPVHVAAFVHSLCDEEIGAEHDIEAAYIGEMRVEEHLASAREPRRVVPRSESVRLDHCHRLPDESSGD